MISGVKKFILSENTLVPLSLVMFLAGAIVWVTTIYAQNLENARAIQELKAQQDQYNQDISKIQTNIAFIKGFLVRHGLKDGM